MSDIIQRNPNDLALHPLLKSQPWMDEDQFETFRRSIRENGVLQPLFVTDGDEVVDGRHRWKGARLEHVAEVPCIVVSSDRAAAIILATILDRRHYTKGARAYLALPLLEKAIAKSAVRRVALGKGNLRPGGKSSVDVLSTSTDKRGKSPDGVLGTPSGKTATEDLAEKLGISADYLKLARHTESLFKQSDKRIADWLELDTEMKGAWELYHEEHPAQTMPWAAWRARELDSLGHKAQDPKTASIIPEDYREAYEDLLFCGEMGLGQINKAVGGALATKGGPRSDLDGGNPALHITLGNKLKSWTTTMFGKWGELAADHRIELAKSIADSAEQWPDEAQKATYLKLKAKFVK